MVEEIDFVIPWVNGNDPEWRAERASYEAPKEADNREVRFRDWDNLRYWFRGVEKYAPFVRKIFFVTWGHLPEWLNTKHSKLVIVNHKDYIPEEYLPTFNANTIELNIHRIKGLSKHFVYFNDDVFVVSPTKPDDYFSDGMPKDTFALNTVCFAPDSVGHIIGSDLTVINERFKKRECFEKYYKKYFSPIYGKHLIRTVLLLPWRYFQGFFNNHLCSNFLKSTFEKVWDEYYETMSTTCECKFRNPLNVNQWLMKYWQLAEGNFSPMSSRAGMYYRLSEDKLSEIYDVVIRHKYKFICLNDYEKINDFNKVKHEVSDMFEKILPEKSGFEL